MTDLHLEMIDNNSVDQSTPCQSLMRKKRLAFIQCSVWCANSSELLSGRVCQWDDKSNRTIVRNKVSLEQLVPSADTTVRRGCKELNRVSSQTYSTNTRSLRISRKVNSSILSLSSPCNNLQSSSSMRCNRTSIQTSITMCLISHRRRNHGMSGTRVMTWRLMVTYPVNHLRDQVGRRWLRNIWNVISESRKRNSKRFYSSRLTRQDIQRQCLKASRGSRNKIRVSIRQRSKL